MILTGESLGPFRGAAVLLRHLPVNESQGVAQKYFGGNQSQGTLYGTQSSCLHAGEQKPFYP